MLLYTHPPTHPTSTVEPSQQHRPKECQAPGPNSQTIEQTGRRRQIKCNALRLQRTCAGGLALTSTRHMPQPSGFSISFILFAACILTLSWRRRLCCVWYIYINICIYINVCVCVCVCVCVRVCKCLGLTRSVELHFRPQSRRRQRRGRPKPEKKMLATATIGH